MTWPSVDCNTNSVFVATKTELVHTKADLLFRMETLLGVS